MATFAQLQTDVQEFVGDSQADSWTPAQYKAAVNAAILNYCEKTGVTYVETNITSNAEGMVHLPDPVLSVRRVMTSSGIPYFTISVSPVHQDIMFDESGEMEEIEFNVSIHRFNGFTEPISILMSGVKTDTGCTGDVGGEPFPSSGPCVLVDAPDSFSIHFKSTESTFYPFSGLVSGVGNTSNANSNVFAWALAS